MEKRRAIKDFYGVIIGYIFTDEKTGNERATDFFGRILGYYNKSTDTTTNFYGVIVNRGNVLSSMITEAKQTR